MAARLQYRHLRSGRVVDRDEPDPSLERSSRWEVVGGSSDAAEVAADPVGGDGRPGGNASQAEWAAYAVSRGMSEEDAGALSRNELRDLYAD